MVLILGLPDCRAKPEVRSRSWTSVVGWADGHSFNSERLWLRRRDELIRWVKKNQRPPHYASGDDSERAFAAWVSAYRKHAQHGRHLERIKELDLQVRTCKRRNYLTLQVFSAT